MIDGSEENHYALNYLYHFDQIFTAAPLQMVTGKLTGDPPVSPAVMAVGLLQDLIHSLDLLRQQEPEDPCPLHHTPSATASGASYHDLCDLFGYPLPDQPFPFDCSAPTRHHALQGLEQVASQLLPFFHGHHPSRRNHYPLEPLPTQLQPARTVYTANYLLSATALEAFIPFATLRLRMAGPALGRELQQRWGERFVAVNLPMLHQRLADEEWGRCEHRPGVHTTNDGNTVDLGEEFERQFYGDVLLFTLEQLEGSPTPTQLQRLLRTTEASLRQRYRQQRQQIRTLLQQFEQQWNDPSCWWYQQRDRFPTVEQFIANLRANFLSPAPAWQQIDNPDHRSRRLQQIEQAILEQNEVLNHWRQLLAEQ